MEIYVFYDGVRETIVPVLAVDEDDAWEALADAYGSAYVFDNMSYVENAFTD